MRGICLFEIYYVLHIRKIEKKPKNELYNLMNTSNVILCYETIFIHLLRLDFLLWLLFITVFTVLSKRITILCAYYYAFIVKIVLYL